MRLYDPFPAKFETDRSDWAPTYQGAQRQNFKPYASAVMDRSLRSYVIGGKSAWASCDRVGFAEGNI